MKALIELNYDLERKEIIATWWPSTVICFSQNTGILQSSEDCYERFLWIKGVTCYKLHMNANVSQDTFIFTKFTLLWIALLSHFKIQVDLYKWSWLRLFLSLKTVIRNVFFDVFKQNMQLHFVGDSFERQRNDFLYVRIVKITNFA